MRWKIAALLISGVLGLAIGTSVYHRHQKLHAYEKIGRAEVKAAMEIVKRPGWETAISGPACQTGLRLALILYEESDLMHYEFRQEDIPSWQGLLHDTSASRYARHCACFFLLDADPEARAFLTQDLRNPNPRCRFNAGTVLELFMRQKCQRDPAQVPEWTILLTIDLLSEPWMDRIDTDETRRGIRGGQGVDHDSTDIMSTPMWDLCRMLGWLQDSRAVDSLIQVLERDSKNPAAASALGYIGDRRAIPILLRILKDNTGYDFSEASALAQLKCREAVPVLGERLLEVSKDTSSVMLGSDISRLLNALLEIRDPAAIPFIKTYLKGAHNPKDGLAAQRVLVQLEEEDPVPALIEMLTAAGIGKTQEANNSARIGPLENFLQFGGDEYIQAALINDLARYGGTKAVGHLFHLAQTSPSAFLRRCAIDGLRNSKSPEATAKLIMLLKEGFPDTLELKITWGWHSPPKTIGHQLKLHVVDALKTRTQQDLGEDAAAWEAWQRAQAQR
jgi:HEAT repeat protein